MNFSLNNIQECEEVELEFLSQDVNKYSVYMTKNLYTYLNKLKRK